jgi:drug/metabolite transporter (DMT)-like permease
MTWFWLAIVGHTLNGIAFVIDKVMLSSAFKRSATYAAMIGSISFVVLVAAPFVRTWPPLALLPAIAGFGSVFVFALWAFFEALKRGEASRVVPIVGSLIPMATLAGSVAFLHEAFTRTELVGFVLLLIATWLLTTGKQTKRIDATTFGLCATSALLFAASSLFGKFAFAHAEFLPVFVGSRVAAGLTGVFIGLIAPGASGELLMILRPKKSAVPHKGSQWVVIGQILGGLGFLLVNIAIKSGSAALVNALQAVQYALLVAAAFVLKSRAPKLLGEDLSRNVVIKKSIALLITGFGMYLII